MVSKTSQDELRESLTTVRLVRLTGSGFERQDVVTIKGKEKEAQKAEQKHKQYHWRRIVVSDKECPKCGEKLDDWGVFKLKEGYYRVFKCPRCGEVENEESDLLEIVEMIKEERIV